MSTALKTYSELRRLETFEERYHYLRLQGQVGEETFGFDRYLNQRFYRSKEWKSIRNHIILRDNGCDLGIEGRDIIDKIIIHHMNPIAPRDLIDLSDWVMDPENLICVSHDTHNAIPYGDEFLLQRGPVERKPGDTKLW